MSGQDILQSFVRRSSSSRFPIFAICVAKREWLAFLKNCLGQGVDYIHGSMKAVEDGHILVTRQLSMVDAQSSSGSEEKVTYDYLLLACGRFGAISGLHSSLACKSQGSAR